MLRLLARALELKIQIWFHRIMLGYIGTDIWLAELRDSKLEVAAYRDMRAEWDKSLDNLYINRRNLYVR